MSAVSFRFTLVCLVFLPLLSSCGKEKGISVDTNLPETPETEKPSAGTKGSATCLSPAKVLLGVEYTCTDGKKRKGTFAVGSLAACKEDGEEGCVAGGSFKAFPSAERLKLIPGNVKQGVTIAGVAGTLTFEGPTECSADGETGCVVPTTGTLKAADTSNFTGWDIRRKRNPTTGAVLTFAGLAGQSKTCRNRANTAIWNNLSGGTVPTAASHSIHALVGLDFLDTIDDSNNNLDGLPGEIPAWTIQQGPPAIAVGPCVWISV